MRLELQLFIKLVQLFNSQLPIFITECAVLAKYILEEFPVDMFNEILVEYFDACMYFSEGNVEVATKVTKKKSIRLESGTRGSAYLSLWHRVRPLVF